MHLIRRADYARMPWKNGGGVTEQIAIEPAGATVADFTWRVSMAQVASNGPFSLFPGYQRILVVTEGAGIVLPSGVVKPLTPVRFSGDDAITATLVNGPIRDFNVIYRGCSAECEVVRVDDDTTFSADADTQLVTCLAGSVRCGDLQIDAGDTLRADGAALQLLALEPSIVVHVRLKERHLLREIAIQAREVASSI